ncbi:MAG TPA: tyrosine-type recombinase/integrase, partial [Candidatus Gallimonas intestinavium]|nr:tyrosine-type recombinase/integrase [Candidatus Gallimonas intestinavium]
MLSWRAAERAASGGTSKARSDGFVRLYFRIDQEGRNNERIGRQITCHGLRHTYCSLLLAQNVPIQTVSKYMGHRDSTVTLKVYSHFIPDTQGIAVNALNRLT